MTSSRTHRLAGITVLVILSQLPVASSASAGAIEIKVRDPLGRPYVGPILLHPPYDPDTAMLERMVRRETLRGFTDRQGIATFLGLEPHRYTVSFPALLEGWLQPSENPAAPAPVMTLFDDEETLRMEVRIELGWPVGVVLASPELDAGRAGQGDYVVHYLHRPSGFHRTEEVRPHLPRMTRFLSQGLWEVWAEAPPGQLLVDLDRDRRPLQGSVASLVLAAEPRPPLETTWLTFAYASPATIEGEILVKSGVRQELEVVATILEPGDWFEDVELRGGSLYSPVSAEPGPDRHYRLALPDGLWQVFVRGERLLASEPGRVVVEARAGEAAEAHFEVELEEEPRRTFRVRVMARDGRSGTRPRRDGRSLVGAVVHLTALDDPGEILRQGRTESFGVDLELVPLGHYLLLAGHPDYLEAELELRAFEPAERGELRIELPAGGDFYLTAVDLDGARARDVEWTIERLGPPLELKLRDADFIDAKTERVAVTDDSGRVGVPGFYGGAYRLRAERPAGAEAGGLFHVGRSLERVAPTVELYLPERGSQSAWARQLPAANLLFELVCDDHRPPPGEASVIVIDLDGPAHGIEAAMEHAVFVREGSPLVGRRRDRLLVGPLDQGVYRLALRPAGFVRWTWAFEAYDGGESFPIQIDIDEKEPAALLDQGPFQLECAPAVDLVPRVLEGEMPDVRDVDVEVRLLDAVEDVEIASPPPVARRLDRAELRLLPQGEVRLDFVLSHPHFLPTADLSFQIALDLQRGRYIVVAPEIAGIGGAIRIRNDEHRPARPAGPGALVRIEPDGGEAIEIRFEGEPTLVPSLIPGLYDVTLCADLKCEAEGTLWDDVEVVRGRTVELEAAASEASEGGVDRAAEN